MRLLLAISILTLWVGYLPAQRVFSLETPHSFSTANGSECSFDSYGYRSIPNYLCTCNNLDAAKTLQTHQLWPGGASGVNLSGLGLNKLGIWDGGAARTSHRELLGRVQVMDSPATLSGHTTAVLGNMIASGLNPNVRGMCYATQIKNWNFSNDNAEIIAAANDLLVSNHSYASTSAWTNIGGQWYWYGDSSLHLTKDWKFGYYDNRSRIWDSIMVAQPYYLMVKASGNDRGNGVAPGTPHFYWNGTAWAGSTTTRDTVGPYDCISTFGNAKNILCVGAVPVQPNGLVGNINTFNYSSWGPTDDGRIKPDLVAPSGVILSVGSANDSAYAGLGGTSMSAPSVTASLLLLQQYHQQLKGVFMRNATLKALAIQSARRCKPNLPGPDYECGWGIPDMAKAASILKDSLLHTIQERSLQNADSFIYYVYLKPTDTLRSTLVWSDPSAVTGVPKFNDTTLKLVNDLDLSLCTQTDSIVALPFVLNPNNPAAAATHGNNVRDNVEQILVSNLPAAWYKLKVKHKGSLQNLQAQSYSLVSSGYTNNLVALPVTWLNAKAEVITDWVTKISWQTAAEFNNSHFLVWHGINVDNMKVVAFAGSGSNTNSQMVRSYSAYHMRSEGFAGTHYYKIEQIDTDGKSSFSPVFTINEESITNGINAIIPNPFTDKFEIEYEATPGATVDLQILNLSGQTLLQQNLDGSQTSALVDASSLPSGVYSLKLIEASGRTYYARIVKL
jgi:hypothetical protein